MQSQSFVKWVFVVFAVATVTISTFVADVHPSLAAGGEGRAMLRSPATQSLGQAETSTGKAITPLAAKGASFQFLYPSAPRGLYIHANHASAVSLSHDGRVLAVLTSGFNRHYENDGKLNERLSVEHLFLFDVTHGVPQKIQVLDIPNSYLGLGWGKASSTLYLSGGKDDLVYEFRRLGSQYRETRTFKLNHHGINGDLKTPDPMWGPWPMAAQLALSPDGRSLLAANMMNDSVSLIDLSSGRVAAEQDLRPGKINKKDVGTPGGTYPGSIVWTSPQRAYVASERDRQIIELAVDRDQVQARTRIPVLGQPVALAANRSGSRVFVAQDNVDQVAVVDTRSNTIIEQIPTIAPKSVYINSQKLGGAAPDALALTPDENTLLVSNGGQNSVAVVALGESARGLRVDPDELQHPSVVVGLIPTGWYPTGLATAADGSRLFIINGKSPPGANSDWCKVPQGKTCFGEAPSHFPWGVVQAPDGKPHVFADNGFAFEATHGDTVLQRQRAGLLALPMPTPAELARLSRQVARNNGFDRPERIESDQQLFGFLRQHIKHVIYIIKENRSYDQILGDLEVGNGDPRLALFPEAITPNHHALARNFVTLDHFLVSGEGSWTGMQWSTAGRTSVFAERNDFVDLAGRGGDSAIHGMNRGLNMALPTNALRRQVNPTAPLDPDILPGTRDVAELDGPGGLKGEGYIWDAALRAGLTVRNYGLLTRDGRPTTNPIRRPSELGQRIADSSNPALIPYTAPYFYGINLALPDYWRVQEWRKEFEEYESNGTLPNLSLMWLGGDHFGKFNTALDGVNTPDRQMADNDYALGQIVEAVANSPYKDNTIIVSIEDDTWDGVDHVDAFRSPIFMVGPYVKQHALVSARYTTVNVIKTLTEILGTAPVGINDALAAPMSDVFDVKQADWTYKAIIPDILYETQLPLPSHQATHSASCSSRPGNDAAFWTEAMKEQGFSHPDAGEFGAGNKGLWKGIMGNRPYPGARDGRDLSRNREALLAQWRGEFVASCEHGRAD